MLRLLYFTRAATETLTTFQTVNHLTNCLL